MNKQANILFIPSSISGYSAEPTDATSHRGYYQQQICALLNHRICTLEEFQALGRQLVAIASQAYLARQIDAVEEAAQLMLALPIAGRLENIARYYRALCRWQQGDVDNARQSLERVVEKATPQYRARALQVIGLTYQARGDVDAALPFYVAAGKAAADCHLLTLAQSQQMISVVCSIHGDHARALEHLEKQFPLVRAVGKHYPAAYYTFLNHFAVELNEVGRVAEAEAALSIALASPFATAYPEWSETRDEIAAKRKSASPSVVAIHRVPEADRTVEADQAAEADRAINAESQRKPEPSRPVAFIFPTSNKDFFQRSTITIPASTAIALNAVSILDRVLICIGPRAPPVLS